MISDPLAEAFGIEPNPDFNFNEEISRSLYCLNSVEVNRQGAITRNTRIVTCDKCGTSGGEPNMYRWHFDKCKTVLRECVQCGEIIPRQGTKDSRYNQMKYCGQKCYFESKIGIAPIEMTSEVREKLSNKIISDETRKRMSQSAKNRRKRERYERDISNFKCE